MMYRHTVTVMRYCDVLVMRPFTGYSFAKAYCTFLYISWKQRVQCHSDSNVCWPANKGLKSLLAANTVASRR